MSMDRVIPRPDHDRINRNLAGGRTSCRKPSRWSVGRQSLAVHAASTLLLKSATCLPSAHTHLLACSRSSSTVAAMAALRTLGRLVVGTLGYG
jgi:hypothetical protein